MLSWLELAYTQTKALGYCNPSSYQLPGRANVAVAAKRAGIIVATDADDKFKGSKWADMRKKPTKALAQKLMDAYTAYRKDMEAKAKAKKNGAAPADAGGVEPGSNVLTPDPTLQDICTTLKSIDGQMKKLVKIWKQQDRPARRRGSTTPAS